MKNLKLFLGMTAVLLLVTLTAFKCGSENDPVNTIITTTNFESQNFGCGMNLANMQADTVYVINSGEEFARYFNCETDPQIDFSQKTLLVAHGTATSGIRNIFTELSINNGVYSLIVNIQVDITGVAPPWHIELITDKINTNSVMLNINQHL
jgi:hypothetical protein